MGTPEPKPLNIGSVAEATGLPAKTIRYYESIGLVGPPRRTGGNYRLYDERDVTTLRFIERARRLGFSLKEVAELLTLWRDRHRASADVRRLAEAQIRRVDARLSELQDMRRSLQHLMDRCHGDERPDREGGDHVATRCSRRERTGRLARPPEGGPRAAAAPA